MTIANRPGVPAAHFLHFRQADMERYAELVNSNFRRLTEQLYVISQELDTRLTAVERKLKNTEAQAADTETRVQQIIITGGGPGTPGATTPVTEISANTVTVALSGATTTASSVVPANSVLFAVQLAISGLTGATDLDAGVALNPDMFGAALTTSGGIGNHTFINLRYVRGSDLDVLLTANGGNFTGGTADVTGFYWTIP